MEHAQHFIHGAFQDPENLDLYGFWLKSTVAVLLTVPAVHSSLACGWHVQALGSGIKNGAWCMRHDHHRSGLIEVLPRAVACSCMLKNWGIPSYLGELRTPGPHADLAERRTPEVVHPEGRRKRNPGIPDGGSYTST